MNEESRKAHLEKLTSPEQLDRLLVIIRARGWIALLCLLVIVLGILMWALFGTIPMTLDGRGIFFNPSAIELIQSETEGVVEEIYVIMGDLVKKGQALLKIKTLNNQESKAILAPADGRILMVVVLRGQGVAFGQTLLWFQTLENKKELDLVYAFFSIDKGDQIRPGMRAQMMFESVHSAIYGKMEGTVLKVLPYAASAQGSILRSIPSGALREYLTKEEAPVIVLIQPIKDPATPSGFKWTTKKGPPYELIPGSVASIEVFVEEKRPISYLIPIGE
jgi:multidrug resistance efflux pump